MIGGILPYIIAIALIVSLRYVNRSLTKIPLRKERKYLMPLYGVMYTLIYGIVYFVVYISGR